ncbi:hypothetical protein D1007_47198 [Hordeum vulgare]|nr:hypothetical protein D1007_47198 [Hordeum vulgare]
METQREPTKAGAVVAPPRVVGEPAGGGGGVLEHAPSAPATAIATASPAAPPGSATDRDAVLAKVEMERKLSMVKAWEENQKSKADNRRGDMATFELYRRSTIGMCLTETLTRWSPETPSAPSSPSKCSSSSTSIASLPVQALTSTINEDNLPDLKYQFDTIDVDKGGPITALKKCSRLRPGY